MPATFLTHRERALFEKVPQYEEDQIHQFFFVNIEDKKFIASFYGSSTQLWVIIQIGLIKSLGYLPLDWENQIQSNIIEFVAKQVYDKGKPVQDLKHYGKLGKTKTLHFQQILKHLGYRRWQPLIDELPFEKWLIDRGMEHDNERLLLEKLCEKLHNDKILRPVIGTLERFVGGINEQLHKETYRRLASLWSEDFFQNLDDLLELFPNNKHTKHRWLCMTPTANTSKAINETLDKISFMQKMQVNCWDISSIPANRKKRLASIVRNNTNHYIKRIKPIRRYPLLVCFLWETLIDTTDSTLQMYIVYWQNAIHDAKRAIEDYQKKLVKSQREAIVVLSKAGKMLLKIINQELDNDAILENISVEELEAAIELISNTKKPISANYLHFLVDYYPRFKSFSARFLKIIDFDIAFTKDNFGKALSLVKELQVGQKKKLPADAPTNFITQSWQKLVFNNNSIQSNAYELCVLSVLKDRLQSGDVFVKFSRRFADFNSFLIPKAHWEKESNAICEALGGLNFEAKIDEMADELTSLFEPLSELLAVGNNNGEIRIENGQLVLPALVAEELSESAKLLKEQINLRLPKVGLVEIMKEVDNWVNYSNELNDDSLSRNPDHHSLKFAALLGKACNVSLANLARSSDLDYNALWWVANNYFTDENLKRANDLLVNFHHKQWLPSYWGGGTLSSSDGQRFPTRGKIQNARSIPKYFGYGKGVTFYTHTSDQYSQYGSKVIASTERDATYVLDEILANETDLDIQEHTTDTHGYTDLLFAFFNMVDKKLISRLADIKSQRLCKIKSSDNPKFDLLEYPPLKFTGMVNLDYLKKNADEIKRVAASLLSGTVTASHLISKLQAYPRQNNLMQVIQTLGQLEKTIFVCSWLLLPALRKKVTKQLNKGEQLHSLRVYLWFGGDGFIRKQQEIQQQITVRSLNLMCNIVMAWNTVYIQEILKELKAEGFDVNEDDLEHISPAPFEHVILLGNYNFKVEIVTGENGFRPLRKP